MLERPTSGLSALSSRGIAMTTAGTIVPVQKRVYPRTRLTTPYFATMLAKAGRKTFAAKATTSDAAMRLPSVRQRTVLEMNAGHDLYLLTRYP